MLRQSMMRPILFGLIMYLGGCSTSNTDAPRTDQTHPPRYILSHEAEADADLYRCKSCHGLDLSGNGNPVPGCFSCHDSGPPFSIHPLPYTDAADHGPAARVNQLLCRGCHGKSLNNFAGGIVADPKIFNNPAGSCSSAQCHPDARAHPTNWQGDNDPTVDYESSHRTAGSTDVACAVCHNVAADAPGTHPDAPSCFSASFTNADGSATGCHAGGPGAPHAVPFTDAALHGPEARADIAACQQCHGTPGTIQFNGGTAATSCSTALCHSAADAHPTNWQGTNDGTVDYLSSHRNALKQNTTCTICHDFTEGRTAPNSAAPSCFTAGFTNDDGSTTGCHSSGPGAPHALPFTDDALHGPDAKADLKYCQECHAAPAAGGPGSNPRFNVAVGDLVNGCEDCHTADTAHPYPSWSGTASNSHKTAGNLDVACALCHGANLLGAAEGGVGSACDDCHTAGSPLWSCRTALPVTTIRPTARHPPEIFARTGTALTACTTACQGMWASAAPVTAAPAPTPIFIMTPVLRPALPGWQHMMPSREYFRIVRAAEPARMSAATAARQRRIG